MKKATLASSQLILVWGKLLALVPFARSTNNLIQKLYPCLLLALSVCSSYLSIHKRIAYSSHMEISVFILAAISDLVLFACSSLAILNANFLHIDDMRRMYDKLHTVDGMQRTTAERPRGVLLGVIIKHILWLANIAITVPLFQRMAPWYTYYFLLREAHHYHIMVSVMVMRYQVRIMRDELRCINALLSSVEVNAMSTSITGQFMMVIGAIRDYNKTYGVFYVFLYIYIIINLVVPLNLMLSMTQQKESWGHYGTYIIGIAVTWCVIPCIIFRDIIVACEEVAFEMDRLPTNCYCVSSTFTSAKLQRELREFAVQVGLTAPMFSANGWFDVNYKMILPTVTMIISYAIVLLQYYD